MENFENKIPATVGERKKKRAAYSREKIPARRASEKYGKKISCLFA